MFIHTHQHFHFESCFNQWIHVSWSQQNQFFSSPILSKHTSLIQADLSHTCHYIFLSEIILYQPYLLQTQKLMHQDIQKGILPYFKYFHHINQFFCWFHLSKTDRPNIHWHHEVKYHRNQLLLHWLLLVWILQQLYWCLKLSFILGLGEVLWCKSEEFWWQLHWELKAKHLQWIQREQLFLNAKFEEQFYPPFHELFWWFSSILQFILLSKYHQNQGKHLRVVIFDYIQWEWVRI